MRTIVITGASDGIGAAAAARLSADHRIVLVGRNPEKTHAVAQQVGADGVFVADFAELAQVRELGARIAERYPRIDVLANNAGGLFSGPTITTDGVELTFQVNHLAPFLLTQLLRSALAGGAVVNTSSIAARIFSRFDIEDVDTVRRYRAERAYGNAKLANILFTRGLHARGVRSVAFHPGNVATSFASDTNSPLRWLYTTVLNRSLITADAGGSTLEFFIRHTGDWQSGQYYGSSHKPGRIPRKAADDGLVEQLWTRSEQLLGD